MNSDNNLPACVFGVAQERWLPFIDIDDLDLPDDQLGKAIMTNWEAGRTAANQAIDRLRTAGAQLVEAKERSLNFDEFLRNHCNGLSRSWAYDLIEIGRGNIAAVRAKAVARKDRHRIRKRIAAAKSSVRSGTDTNSGTRKLSMLAEFKELVEVLFRVMDPETRQLAISYVNDWDKNCELTAELSYSVQ